MRRKILPAILLALSLAVGGWGLACQSGGGSPPQMNLLLITLDTTRADYLGLYGHDKPTSPNMDKLAEDCVVFDRAIAQAAVTPVSHASILTGLNPYNHQLRVLHGLTENTLEEDQVTLAEFWKNAGGQTSAFISAFPVGPSFGLDQGFEHFDQTFPQADGEGVVTQTGSINTGMSQRRADATTDAAASWLQNGMTKDKPFFMWVHYFDPHDTLVLPPQDWLDEMLDGDFQAESEERSDILRAIYNCEIYYMDEQIGRLFDEFKSQEFWDTTMIVIVADHGEGLGDHNWWSHGILYEEQVRVPLLIRIPGQAGGQRVASVVRTIDLMPTILQAVGIAQEEWPEMDGESLVETMRAGRTPEELIAYTESVNIMNYGRPDIANYWDRKDDKLYCLTTATGKLIYHQLKPEKSEFYNLTDDPLELVNRIGQSSQEMESLTRKLRAMDIFSEHMPGMTGTDLERARRLKGLGYIE